ncbi:hypothetical protein Tco_0335847 [Tanacetum coccineum]
MSTMLSSHATLSMEKFPFGHCPEGNGDVSSLFSSIANVHRTITRRGIGCLKGSSENSGGKRSSISMIVEAWLSEKEEVFSDDIVFGLLTTIAAAGLTGSLSELCLIILKRRLSSILIAAGFVQTLFDGQKFWIHRIMEAAVNMIRNVLQVWDLIYYGIPNKVSLKAMGGRSPQGDDYISTSGEALAL